MFTKLIVIATVALSAISAQEFQFQSQYPEYGIIPTAKPEWLELIKNAKIADAPVYKVANGVKTPVGGTKGDHCDWTITNCLAKEDLYQCPKGQWAPTYDDGPSEFSEALYNELRKTNTKTTFFMVGGQVHKFPKLVQQALKDGHELAMHTWSHNYMTSLTNEQIVAELKWNELAIKEATKTKETPEGFSPRFFRPPYGDIDNRVRDVAKALGFTPVIWTHDTNDWALTENKNFKLEYVTGNVTAWTKEQTAVGGVSLEHDLYDVTVKAAIEVLPIFLNNWNVTTVGACNNQPSYKEGNGPNPPVTKPSASVTPSGNQPKPSGNADNKTGDKTDASKNQNQKGENAAVSLASSTFALGVTAAAAIILS
ncbi:unnamed protein product [Cunninghamella blakesleeana]